MTVSTSSRRLMRYIPSQRHSLAGAQMLTGQADDDVVPVVIPHEIGVRRVLRPVWVLLDRCTAHQLSGSPLPDPDRVVPHMTFDRLTPIVVINELATLAGEPDDGRLPRLERW